MKVNRIITVEKKEPCHAKTNPKTFFVVIPQNAYFDIILSRATWKLLQRYSAMMTSWRL